MKTELEGPILVALLFIAAFALGIEFGGSGITGAFGGLGTPNGSGGKTSAPFPKLVLHAQGVDPSDLYASGLYDVIPSHMFAPLAGLSAEFVAIDRTYPFYSGLPQSITLVTNSSGEAASTFPEGTYDVTISGPSYRVGATIQLAMNTTTTVNFTLSPSAEEVTVLKVVSPDSVAGVEPTSMLYALLNYSSPPSSGFSELAGFAPAPPGTVPTSGGTPILLNATILGSYKGAEGYWAALAPLRAYSSYPFVGVMLFQFKPSLQVNSTAG